MKWVARLLVLYAVVLVLVVVVAVAASWTAGGGYPVHARMDPVSHSDYALHRSIAHVP